jgi:hypothetical protein
MQKSLWMVTVLILFVAIVAPNAQAQTLFFSGSGSQGELSFIPGVGNVLTIGAGSGGNGALIDLLNNNAGLCGGFCSITNGYMTLTTGTVSYSFSGAGDFYYTFGSGGTIDIFGGIPSLSIGPSSLLLSASFLSGAEFYNVGTLGLLYGNPNLGSISLNPALGTYNYTGAVMLEDSFPVNPTCGSGGICTQPISQSEIELDYSPAPEPSSLVLFGTGLLGLTGVTRRKLGRKN